MNIQLVFSVLIVSLFQVCICLFEDQIGKFDWKQNYVGKLKFSKIDSKSAVKKIIVATEQNVLGALSFKTGDIIWRHVLERGDQGVIQLLHVDNEVLTVTGTGPYVVRSWHINTGVLLNEWTIPTDKSVDSRWTAYQGKLYQINIRRLTQITIEVVVYNFDSNKRQSTVSMQLKDLMDNSQIIVAGPHLVYTSDESNSIVSVSMLNQYKISQSMQSYIQFSPSMVLKAVDCTEELPCVLLTTPNKKVIVLINEETLSVEPIPQDTTGISMQPVSNDDNILLQVKQINGELSVKGSLQSDKSNNYISGKMTPNFSFADVSISSTLCIQKKDKSVVCHMLLSGEDDAISLVQTPDKVMWVREEALTSITTVDMLDLRVSDVEVAIEKEFDSKETGCLGMFVRRIVSQVMQIQSFLLTVITLGESSSSFSGRADLVRDQFGLHKMIVVATSVGKIFGIDNFSGEVIWQVFLHNVVPYTVLGKPSIPLYIQRPTRHFPYPAQAALLFKHKVTGEGILYVFNPITGQSLDGDMVRLGYKVKQTLLLHTVSEDFIKGILLMDDQDQIHVYPESTMPTALQLAKSTYFFTANPELGEITGYSLHLSNKEKLISTPIWEIKLNQKITSIVSKNPAEKVHSQGRVLGDRSVLYKYINPNLVAVVTQAEDPVHKNVLSVYLIDVVSGAVIFSIAQKRAIEPIHVVHSENWIVYSYFSDKTRRTEIATLELYEGKVQSNTTAFSSVASPILPMVERQSYILPAGIETMKETITEKGITSKHVLVALNTGGVLEIPWIFLDPRRPLVATAELREEGVIPYMPELPVPAEAIINYNQTMLRVHGIHTYPSGLESTCLVFVYGLDLFYTRVAPSKTFDMLKEDFDHVLITVVLVALSVSAYITKRLASRKALKQAWK